MSAGKVVVCPGCAGLMSPEVEVCSPCWVSLSDEQRRLAAASRSQMQAVVGYLQRQRRTGQGRRRR